MSLSKALSLLPRRYLLEEPTPIQRLHGIENALASSLGGVRIYVKRDDLTSLGGGGNKLRKLEFLPGDAVAQGADTIIATGGRQSNFARLAAAAAASLGLACEVVLARMVPRAGAEYDRNGNVLLDDLFGALIHHLSPGEDSTRFAGVRAEQLSRAGRTAYVATLGGSSAVGSVGYAACALEIQTQSNNLRHRLRRSRGPKRKLWNTGRSSRGISCARARYDPGEIPFGACACRKRQCSDS